MRILYIATCFAPKNVIGAVRTSKTVKYLVSQGYHVTVISPVLEQYDKRDMTLESDELKLTRRITVPYSNITKKFTKVHKKESNRNSANEVGKQTDRSIKSRIYKTIYHLFAIWRSYEWSRKVNCFLRKDKEKYDIVISSYPYIAAHYSAWFAKRHGIAGRWIADFRDPIALDSSIGIEKKHLCRVQSAIVNHADLVTHVSRASIEHFVCFPQDKKKLRWMPNGFDEDDFRGINNLKNYIGDEKLVFSYAGGLYSGERDCSPLFKAIKELVDTKIISLEEVGFYYAGNDYGLLKSQAEKYSVSSIITDKGLLTRTEAVRMQASSDCVIVATFCYSDNGGAMTGKIYEPIMIRRPILLLVNGPGRNSEPGTFVNYLNAGTVYEESDLHGDVTVIKDMIMNMIAEKKENGIVLSRINNEKRDEYNYKSIVAKLSEQIKSIAGEKN